METKTYKTIDRKDWPSGEWDKEPDKIQWQNEATGLPCLAVRHPSLGHWCGYVGVQRGHPDHTKDYDDVNADVHGGLTFAGACNPKEDEATAICHVPDPGEPKDVWWFGFDCAHHQDASPGMTKVMRQVGIADHPFPGESYKTLDYVKNECAELAVQLAQRGGLKVGKSRTRTCSHRGSRVSADDTCRGCGASN